MYCSKWKDIAHCVFILSHLPFEESGKDILDLWPKKKLHICSKNVFNKLETQIMFIFCKNYFEMFKKYTSEDKHHKYSKLLSSPLNTHSQYEKTNIYAVFPTRPVYLGHPFHNAPLLRSFCFFGAFPSPSHFLFPLGFASSSLNWCLKGFE